MRSVSKTISTCLMIALPLALGACGKTATNKKAIDALDEKLVGKNSDPQMNMAVQDRILVDPNLADSANSNAVRAAPTPLQSPLPANVAPDGAPATAAPQQNALHAPTPKAIPASSCKNCGDNRAVTLGGLAQDQLGNSNTGCNANIQYSATWAMRMPAAFAVYPRARVTEAAGATSGPCAMRAVSFATSAAMRDVVDYYYTTAKHAGYSTQYETRAGEHTLGGTRKDGAAYVITFNPHVGGGTDVDIVANHGQ